jgi:hypothetical protein
MTAGSPLRAARARLASWFVPSGRIRRREWWLRYVLVLVVTLGMLGTDPRTNRVGPPPD